MGVLPLCRDSVDVFYSFQPTEAHITRRKLIILHMFFLMNCITKANEEFLKAFNTVQTD